ncbi:hypothetical protein AX14_006144 [Amanita brunnescens Koide BX004]|nr:hypothetical protein AX14_006144 [Amanita brunnescens Koide BX004]
MVSPISRPLLVPSLSVYTKAREQPVKAVLNVVPSLSNCSESHILAKHSANEVDVSIGKDSSANRYSTVSKAAHTLPNFTPNTGVVSVPTPSTYPVVRVPRKLPDRKEEASTEERAGAVKRLPLSNAAIMPHKPTPASSTIRPLPVAVSNGDKTCQGVSGTARQGAEVLMKVETTKPWSGMIPSANGIEHSDECSNAIIGPAVEQALAFVSSEVGEKRWMPDAIVSTQIRKRGCSPSRSAAFMLPVSAPDDPSVPQTHSITLLQRLDELTPSVEVASRRRLKTAREQSSSPESIAARESSIPQISFGPSTCAKAQGQFVEAILDRQPCKGTSLTNRMLANGVMPVSASSNCSGGHLSAKGSTDEALTARPAKDVAPPSSRVVLTLGTSNEVSPCQVGSLKTRHAVEARMRVSMKPASPRFGEAPSAGVLERFKKCSVVTTRHAVKQASMPYLSKMKGKQQVLDSVVSINEGINGTRCSPCPLATSMLPASAPITPTVTATTVLIEAAAPWSVGRATEQVLGFSSSKEGEERAVHSIVIISTLKKSKEVSSPMALAVPRLPVADHAFSPVLPAGAIFPRLPSDETITPIEVISRRQDTNIVNKTSGVYGLHSPSLKTARKQSIVSCVPVSVEGEGQLAQAAAYIREHIKCCSFASDKFPCHSDKVPPDKSLDVIGKEMKANILHALPVSCPEEAIESNRRSDERLIEADKVSEMWGSPVLAGKQKSSHEPFLYDWETVQDGATCVDVLREASAAKEADDAAAPCRNLMVVKNDTPIRLPGFPMESMLPSHSQSKAVPSRSRRA